MNIEDFNSEAYKAGKKAAQSSRDEGHLKMESHHNPYEYGSAEWQLWNLGWNYELIQNG